MWSSFTAGRVVSALVILFKCIDLEGVYRANRKTLRRERFAHSGQSFVNSS
jgi:hypothetical protein